MRGRRPPSGAQAEGLNLYQEVLKAEPSKYQLNIGEGTSACSSRYGSDPRMSRSCRKQCVFGASALMVVGIPIWANVTII